ncbi:hypothetical protein M433DRAFT_75059 [Acidomyces richmondensis BFW]|nr:MAG: hypothetical protein FE78DRAFT_152489 [Acidomyces sp. 'richmondensis']KYG41823.1 hypothetical protein M433DRAFT_75059 [Acidomyces richmondensis BFW]
MLPPEQGQPRQRRRQPTGPDHVKHRRTRSGCYTCRQRRIKCDETHPICDRCRKGKRECTYPGTASSSSSKPARGNARSKDSQHDSGSSPSEDEEGDEKEPLPATLHEEEDESEPQSTISQPSRSTDASNSKKNMTTSPGLDGSARGLTRPQPIRSTSKHSTKTSISQSGRWISIPKDVQFYLRYHKECLSHHHYAFKYDGGDFLKTTFLEIAMNDDSQALLYAIVAFAAYHHAIAQDDGRISKFLQFYNTSITMLHQTLLKKRHNVSTLLTILQLATIEEFLGDWVNLLGHQRAAHQILTDLFNPETIMQDETRRKIISWYIRFDLFAGMMGGGKTNLGRDWFAAVADFYARQARDRPNDLGARFEDYFASSRLLATDVALLMASKTTNTIADAQFIIETNDLLRQFGELGRRLETAHTDPSCFVKSFPRAPPKRADDITDYRDPNFLYGGELFTMNFVLIDFWAIELMFKNSLAIMQQMPLHAELQSIAMKKCKMFEAIEYYDKGPAGAILGCQASLGIASLFLPKDEKHTLWCRRKYALIEQKGYIYPPTLRKRMSEVWNVDVTRWWLPNDEGYPAIIRSIRDFIEYRRQNPKDSVGQDVQAMSGVFRDMAVGDQNSSQDYLSTPTSSDNFEGTMSFESSPEHFMPS